MAENFVIDPAGNVRRTEGDEQTQRFADAGAGFVTPETAQRMYQQQSNTEYWQSVVSPAEQALIGGATGASMGLLPGLLTWGAGRFGSPETEARMRSMYQGLDSSGYYKAGDVGGTLLALAASEGSAGYLSPFGRAITGAGGLAERLALRALPETTSALGNIGRSALGMAARGATEGALLNVGSHISSSVVWDRPFTAQSLLASGAEGALMGGLLGGAIGGTGKALGEGFKALGGVASRAGGNPISKAFERLGGGRALEAEMEADFGGVLNAVRRLQEDVLNPNGVNLSSRTKDILRTVKGSNGAFTATKADLLDYLEKEAPGVTPSAERITGRFQNEIMGKYSGTVEELKAWEKALGLSKDLENVKGKAFQQYVAAGKAGANGVIDTVPVTGFESGSWKQWYKAKDDLIKRIGKMGLNPTLEQEVTQKALNILDSELSESLGVAETQTGRKGLADAVRGAEAGQRLTARFKELLEEKLASEGAVGIKLYPGDAKSVALGAMYGGPKGALGASAIVAGRGLAGVIGNALEPHLAQRAYELAIGSRASAATGLVRSRIRSAVQGFFAGSGRTAVRASSLLGSPANASLAAGAGSQGRYGTAGSGPGTPSSQGRKGYEAALETTSALLSPQHRDRVLLYAQELSKYHQLGLADELLKTYQRASQYLQWNLPVSSKQDAARSLRQLPEKQGLDMKEWKFLRIDQAIKNPLSLLDHLEDGTLGSEEVQAVKYVYPELHQEIVSGISQGILEMKQKGEYLPIDKVSQLGLALDAPVDPILEPDFVSGVQRALALPPGTHASATGGQHSTGPAIDSQSLMTPVEKSQLA